MLTDEATRCLKSLREAIANNDLEETRRIRHGLRGFAGDYGVSRLAELAGKLEHEGMGMHRLQDLVPQIEEAVEQLTQRIRNVA